MIKKLSYRNSWIQDLYISRRGKSMDIYMYASHYQGQGKGSRHIWCRDFDSFNCSIPFPSLYPFSYRSQRVLRWLLFECTCITKINLLRGINKEPPCTGSYLSKYKYLQWIKAPTVSYCDESGWSFEVIRIRHRILVGKPAQE